MEAKTMYAVEHYYTDDCRTYDIFETLDDAENFTSEESNWDKNHFPLFIFKADYNIDLIYQEENGNWNYEDFSDTILGNYEIIKNINDVK